MPTLTGNYEDFVVGMRDLFNNAVPSKDMIEIIRQDVIVACVNVNKYQALAILTQVAKGVEEARKLAAETLLNNLPNFSPASAELFNNGKNFASSGLPTPLIFRDAVDVEYNYAANDDLDPSEYGNRRIQDILSDEERWKAKLKLLTKEKNLRQENIRYEHPRMLPIATSVKHKLSFLGTQSELLRNANLTTND